MIQNPQSAGKLWGARAGAAHGEEKVPAAQELFRPADVSNYDKIRSGGQAEKRKG